MNSRFFWRVALVETLFVGGPLLVVLLLPLGGNPLTDWGLVIGPGVWILGSLATGRILSLPLPLTIVSAVAGGVAGAIIGVAIEHYGALPIAIGVFAASCAGYDAPAEAGDGPGRGAARDGDAAVVGGPSGGVDAGAASREPERQRVSASLDDAA